MLKKRAQGLKKILDSLTILFFSIFLFYFVRMLHTRPPMLYIHIRTKAGAFLLLFATLLFTKDYIINRFSKRQIRK